ncbi:hypothetical protein KLP28_05240 [Nocardioidaceae bacterium]|nr:hypothetical protein KLP28_05240 [Nocardioidaceae bacterium]
MTRTEWRSPRVAAYAVGLCALIVLVTLVVGGVGAVRESRAVAAVEVDRTEATAFGGPAAVVSCLGRWCNVAWRVSAPRGSVRLDRLVLPALGPDGGGTGRRLLGGAVDGDTLSLPPVEAVEDAADEDTQDTLLAVGREVPAGRGLVVAVVVEIATDCRAGDVEPVSAVMTVSRGDVVDQRRSPPVALPCR